MEKDPPSEGNHIIPKSVLSIYLAIVNRVRYLGLSILKLLVMACYGLRDMSVSTARRGLARLRS
jgi:hypothetical protein